MNEPTYENSRLTPEQKETSSLLHSIDTYVLRVGMSRLYDHFDSLPATKFPGLIIFPESSARPLAYGVKAILEHLCRVRHLSVPMFRFMLTIKESEATIKAPGGSLRLRAEELMSESSTENVFVVDDTLHTGFTVKSLYAAFQSDQSPNLSYFAFYDTEGLVYSDDEQEQRAYATIVESGLKKEQIYDHFGFTEAREEEIIDAEFLDHPVEPSTRLEKDLIKYGGFTYRLPMRHKLSFEKTMVTGVTKRSGERFSKPAEDAHLDKMRQLRGEIFAIASHTIEQKQKNFH